MGHSNSANGSESRVLCRTSYFLNKDYPKIINPDTPLTEITNIWACLLNYFRKPSDVGVETFSIGYGRNSTRGVDVDSLHLSLGYIKRNMFGRHTIMQVEVGKDPVDSLAKLEKEMRFSLTELPVPFVTCPLYGMMAIGPYVRFYKLDDPNGTMEELHPSPDGSAWHIRHDDKAIDSTLNWLFNHFVY